MYSENTSVSSTQPWQIRAKVFQVVCVGVVWHDDPHKTNYAFRGLETKFVVRSHAARNTSDCPLFFWKTQLCVVCMYTCKHVFVQVCPSTQHVWKSSGCLFQLLFTLLFESGVLTDSSACWSVSPLDRPIFTTSSGLSNALPHAWLFTWVLGI